MGRPPLEKKQQQLTVALPPEVRIHLDAAAKAGDRSIAEEVRRRLDKTIQSDRRDPVTTELIEGLEHIAALLRLDFDREWYENARAHEAFVTALNQRLAGYAPPPLEGSAAVDLGLVGPTDPPETIGRMRERDDQRLSGYRYLHETQERATRRRMARFAKSIKAKKGKDND
jgi:hypothetical protein